MEMQNLSIMVEWVAFALGAAIAGFLLAFLLLRRGIVQRVEAELGAEGVLLVTPCRLGRIEAAAGSAPAMDSGFLLLVATGLYFRSWFGGRESFIPGASITYIGALGGVSGRGDGESRREKHTIAVRFLNTSGKEDGLVVRLLYPERWVDAIKTHLITRMS